MHKIILLLLAGLFILGMETAGAQIRQGDILSLQQCIDIALQKHPNINAAHNTIKVSESKIGQAKSGYYPQLSLQSNYSRIGPSSSTLLHPDPYDQYTNSLNLSQTIFDFGKTSTHVDIQNLTKESSQADLEDVTAQVILGVKQHTVPFLRQL